MAWRDLKSSLYSLPDYSVGNVIVSARLLVRSANNEDRLSWGGIQYASTTITV